tara:strand:- start:14160 stop:15563 length:1404 start_codon:yes stop_codon:yes gene_type:complete
MFNSEHLQKKWQPVLDHESLPAISDNYRKTVTAVLLENQEVAIREQKQAETGQIFEAAPTNAAGTGGFGGGASAPTAGYDPILISLVRRAMPQLIAYDIVGVQPMSGPTGLIFAMKSQYVAHDGARAAREALFNEPVTEQSGIAGGQGTDTVAGVDDTTALTTDPFAQAAPGAENTNYFGDTTSSTKGGMATATGEALGDAGTNSFREMAFSIDKTTVTAKTRALKAEYTTELAQDLKAIHGLDAETELSNILSTEILAEINREVVRTVNGVAKAGAQVNVTSAGTFDLDTDSNGRWSVEKFKGLMFQIERDANTIAVDTRRGRGNIIICSADIASALSMTGVLDYNPSLQNDLGSDVANNTFAGVLNGRYNVYIDPYFQNPSTAAAGHEYYTIGYKGSSPYDAGLFYCPYVPLQMVRATGENTFQPKIGFKTRYGLQQNPFVSTSAGPGSEDSNVYYRKVKVTNLM